MHGCRLPSCASYDFSPLENRQPTSTKQQDACKSMQQSAKKGTAKPCAHASEKEHEEIQLCESSPRMEGPEICCATSLPIADACNKKLQCTNDAVNPIPAPSYVCDIRHDDGAINQAEDSNNSALARISYHQAPEDTTRPGQCKNRFSPLLTFRRRVKRKINLDEPAVDNHSKDNDKQCSTLTCGPPSLLVNATPLLEETGGNSLDTEYKVCFSLILRNSCIRKVYTHIHGRIVVLVLFVRCYLLKNLDFGYMK